MSETSAETKRVYPYVSANVWTQLRQLFQRKLPSKVTASYLQTALGFESEKGARNLLPQLRLLGLIDEEGVPTDLAARFRLDEEYPAAAQEMVDAVYPEELRELFPGPDAEASKVAGWLMRHTGGGQGSAAVQARLYVLLTSGQLPSGEKAAKSSGSKTSGVQSAPRKAGRKAAASAPSDKVVDPPKPADQPGGGMTPPTPPAGGSGSLPGLHIDVQIHIDAEATSEQIDAVFASMAKHLYGRA